MAVYHETIQKRIQEVVRSGRSTPADIYNEMVRRFWSEEGADVPPFGTVTRQLRMMIDAGELVVHRREEDGFTWPEIRSSSRGDAA